MSSLEERKKLDEWVEANQNKHICQCGCKQFIKIRRYYHCPSHKIPRYIGGHYRVKGPNSPSWKGGITKYHGYVYLKNPKHPRAGPNGYVKRAVIVWEENTGRKVKKGQIIHHKNEIKDDDRFENLELTERSMHAAGHSKGNKYGRLKLPSEEFVRMRNQGASLELIARKYNCCRETVKRRIKEVMMGYGTNI